MSRGRVYVDVFSCIDVDDSVGSLYLISTGIWGNCFMVNSLLPSSFPQFKKKTYEMCNGAVIVVVSKKQNLETDCSLQYNYGAYHYRFYTSISHIYECAHMYSHNFQCCHHIQV